MESIQIQNSFYSLSLLSKQMNCPGQLTFLNVRFLQNNSQVTTYALHLRSVDFTPHHHSRKKVEKKEVADIVFYDGKLLQQGEKTFSVQWIECSGLGKHSVDRGRGRRNPSCGHRSLTTQTFRRNWTRRSGTFAVDYTIANSNESPTYFLSKHRTWQSVLLVGAWKEIDRVGILDGCNVIVAYKTIILC